MPQGSGVTWTEVGDKRFKIRWRERRPDGSGWISRSTTIDGEALRDKLCVQIRESLALTGAWRPVASAELVPANLWDAIEAWINARVAGGRFSPRTAATYRSYRLRVVRSLHAVTGIPADDPLPVTVLTRANFDAVKARDRQRQSSDSMRYAPLRMLIDAWRWMSDDPKRYPLVPTPPNDLVDWLPPTPIYGRTVAPTLEHVDACLRAFPLKVSVETRIFAILLRYTGLRASQLLAVEREDLDVSRRTLWVRKGKTRRERAEQRTIPLSVNLFKERGVAEYLELGRRGPLFEHRTKPGARWKVPSWTFRLAWEQAILPTGDPVPREVWEPPSRLYGRPEHSFRAAFRAALEDAGVDTDVVKWLIGHAGDVAETHYGRDLDKLARAAVDALPMIDWTGRRLEVVVDNG